MSIKKNKNVPNVLHKRSQEREKYIGLNVLGLYSVFSVSIHQVKKHPFCYYIKYF